ncbi:MAG: DUF5666 domain-containing protein [Rhodospirillales bacterium]
MRRLPAVLALSLVTFFSASCQPGMSQDRAPTTTADGGIGGTGISPRDGGIGGTGRTADVEGGIGGTGIVGTITGFGSIIVNGLHVDYDEAMAIQTTAGGGTARDLRIGHVVAVEAADDGGRLVARAIEVQHVLAGPVTAVDRANGIATVMGERVRISDDTRVRTAGGDTRGDIADVQPGNSVTVSGFRSDGTIEATRIEPGPHPDFAAITGTVTRMDGSGIYVDGRRVVIEGPVPPDLSVGRDVTLAGRAVQGTLRVRKATVRPRIPFGGRVRRLSVEGIVRPGLRVRGLRVGPVPVGPEGRAAAGLRPGQRMIAVGELGTDRRLKMRTFRALKPRTWKGRARTLVPRVGPRKPGVAPSRPELRKRKNKDVLGPRRPPPRSRETRPSRNGPPDKIRRPQRRRPPPGRGRIRNHGSPPRPGR